MNIKKVYLQFLDLVNKNATNNNLNVDLPRFIMLFNDVQIRYLSWVLDNRKDSSLRKASDFLVFDKKLQIAQENQKYDSFSLPHDYFDFSNLHVKASQLDCKMVDIFTDEIKADDLEVILNDKHSRPSFKYRETSYFLTDSGTVTVLKDGFNIDRVGLTYYREPKEVDIEGYINIDSQPSTNIDPEWNGDDISSILIAMEKTFAASNGDTQKYQIAKDKLFNFNK